MGPLGVVEGHPVLNDAPRLEAIGDFLKVDGLLFQASPEALDEDVVEVTVRYARKLVTLDQAAA